MKIIYNNIIPFKGYAAINLFGLLFVRRGTYITYTLLNHEKIHTMQQKELLYIFFYLWYIVEWLVRLIQYGDSRKAYRNICFEREAYANQPRSEYLNKRRIFSFLRYLWQ